MNKIAQYLNEHLLGEITDEEYIRNQFFNDDSILNIKPDMVVYPKVTNDIRKVSRFCWQLAEKGHELAITVRGCGTDQTGAAIGKGIVMNTIAHLNKIIYVSFKNKDQFIHLQPGVKIETIRETLKTHNASIPALPTTNDKTIGGVLANNEASSESGKYGLPVDWVDRLEVILANGDLIETSRINKHELNKKKGLQTFEGEIYRKIDGIIEDHDEIIKSSIKDADHLGYSGIAKVKQHDGSFDLTPLIVGSQGTLGIISEIVLKIDLDNSESSRLLAVFEDKKEASDLADTICQYEPAKVEYIDGELVRQTESDGKKYVFSSDFSDKSIGAIIYAKFNDINAHKRLKNFKKAIKLLSKTNAAIFTDDDHDPEDIDTISDIQNVIALSLPKTKLPLSIINGASIPKNRRDEFLISLEELAKKHALILPAKINWLTGVVSLLPQIDLHTVSDKQKTFRLINDYMELVSNHDGIMLATSGEGRLKSVAAYPNVNDEILGLYKQIREAFDPFNMLNPGVKQTSDLKTLISELNPNYAPEVLAKLSQVN